MPKGPTIDIAIYDGIATVRLFNPARRNAISEGMWRALSDFAQEAGGQHSIRAVLIRGDGEGAFSGGADLSEFAELRAGSANARAYDDLVEGTCRLIEAIPQPTIAMIYGACVGAGASLATSCDLRLVAEDAFFAVPAAKLGLGYDIRGIERFLRVFGSGATRQLLMTAARLPARRAYELGAAHHIYSSLELETATLEYVRSIAANAPLTLTAAKLAIRALTTTPSLIEEARALAERADASGDYSEGRAAFAERRTPHFRGE